MSNKVLNLLLFLLLICSSSTYAFNTRGGFKTDQLRDVLDSLELQIQEARRSGQDISALAMEIETVKNAIETNKQELGKPKKTGLDSAGASVKPKKKTKINLPTSIIDWMIIVVGAIAVVAALLLIFLHIVQKMRKRKRVTPKVEPVKYKKAQLPPKPAENKEKTPVAPEWVTAMRNYNSQKEDRNSTLGANSDLVETVKSEPVESVKAVSPKVEKIQRENSNVKQVGADNVSDPETAHTGNIPPVQNVEKTLPSEPVVRQQDPVEKPVSEPVVSSEELDYVYDSLNSMAEEPQPVVEKPEVPKSRGQIVREQITNAFDSGESPVNIAKKVGMSVGEVELILTLARRI